jgi:hypothetical protein
MNHTAALRIAARFQKEALSDEGKFLGRDCRLRWDRNVWILEELPVKGKKKCKVASFENYSSRGWHGYDAYIPGNILREAKLSASDPYETIKNKLLDAFDQAAEATIAKTEPEHVKHSLWLREMKWREHEEHYLKITPEDTDPIEIKGKDFTVKSKWTTFSVYDPNADMQSMDPHYTMYEASSPTAARKLYQMAKANPDLLKTVSWSTLGDWLQKNKINYESHSSQWH